MKKEHCELCQAKKITHWYHEDSVCWLADCVKCSLPMIVYKNHTVPSEEDIIHMQKISNDFFPGIPWRGFQKDIKDHWHEHFSACLACGQLIELVCETCGYIRMPGWDIQNPYLADDKEYRVSYYINLEDNGAAKEISALRMSMIEGRIPKGGKIFDLGAGIGTFLSTAQDAGYQARGGDISLKMIQEAHKRGRKVERMDPNSLMITPSDAITLFDVLEHVRDVPQLLIDLQKSLNKNGILLLTTPNVADVPIEKLKQWRHYRPGEHLHAFTVKSLQKILERYGYNFLFHSYLESVFRRNDEYQNNIISVVAQKSYSVAPQYSQDYS